MGAWDRRSRGGECLDWVAACPPALDDWLAGLSMISNFELSFGADGLRRAFLTLTRREGGRCGLPGSQSQPCPPSRPTPSAPRKDGLGTGGSFRIMRAGVRATWQQRTQ